MEGEKTQITTRLIADEAITRDKINVIASGQAVIRKIKEAADSGIRIKSSTGVDEGTGDVELEVDFEFIGKLHVEEQLTGSVDGANRVFSTSVQYIAGTITVYRNGLKCNDYSETSDTQIEFEEAPLNDGFSDLIEATFIKKPI